MSDTPSKDYELDPDDSAADEPAIPADASSAASSESAPAPRVGKPIDAPISSAGSGPVSGRAKPEPFALEDDDEIPQAMRSIKSLDVCPNCGAAMRGKGEVVCMRCGFDLKTMKQVKVDTGVVEVDPDAPISDDGDVVPRRKPIVIPGRGEAMLPLIAAAVAALALALGYMAGLTGLFPPHVNDKGEAIAGAIGVQTRFLGLHRFVVMTLVWTACGVGALTFLAYLNGMRLGDLKLALSRMLGIVAVAQLVRFLNFSSNAVEWTVQSVLAAGIFAGLSIVLFSLKPKDTPILVGSAIILFLFTWLSAWLVITGTG